MGWQVLAVTLAVFGALGNAARVERSALDLSSKASSEALQALRRQSLAELKPIQEATEGWLSKGLTKAFKGITSTQAGNAFLAGHLIGVGAETMFAKLAATSAGRHPMLAFATMMKQLHNSLKSLPEGAEAIFDEQTRALTLNPCDKDSDCKEGTTCTDGWCAKPGLSLGDTYAALLPQYKKMTEKRICAKPEVAKKWLDKYNGAVATGADPTVALAESKECAAGRELALGSIVELSNWTHRYACYMDSDVEACEARQMSSMDWYTIDSGLYIGYENLQKVFVPTDEEVCEHHTDCPGGEQYCGAGGFCVDNGKYPCKDYFAIGGKCPTVDKLCKEDGTLDEWGCCWSTCGWIQSCKAGFKTAGDLTSDFQCNFGSRSLCCQPRKMRETTIRKQCLPTRAEWNEMPSLDLQDLKEMPKLTPIQKAAADAETARVEKHLLELLQEDLAEEAQDDTFKDFPATQISPELSMFDTLARRYLAADRLVAKFQRTCSDSVGALLSPTDKYAAKDVREAADAARCLTGGIVFGNIVKEQATDLILSDVMPQMYLWATFSCPSIIRVARETAASRGSVAWSTDVTLLGLMMRWESECSEWMLPQDEILAWKPMKEGDGDELVIMKQSCKSCFEDSCCVSTHLRKGFKHVQGAIDWTSKVVQFYLFDVLSMLTTISLSGGLFGWLESATWVGYRLNELYGNIRKMDWFSSAKQEACLDFAFKIFDERYQDQDTPPAEA
mmetsp:Transcript_70409/g.153514  ORF Transcript_70409/g.153514 Transcript_70409/m.153514 type:complete len:730 (+) Transcript_70409:206-2395(+)